jgi:hypothetical protein
MVATLMELVGVTALAMVAFLAYRRWHLRWGATEAEIAGPMPGDERLPGASFTATRAITMRARPEHVWPWLVQIGFNRAGWYSYDLLDNLGRRSADRVIPELQAISIGDWIPMAGTITEQTAFRVEAFERPRMLLWAKPDSTWVWSLVPIDGARTRVVSRLRCRHRPGTILGLAGVLLMELGDFPMFRKLLLNLRQRAERLAAGEGSVGGPASSARSG